MSEEYDYPKGEGEKYEGDGPNVRYDDFVGRIVQDPNEPPNVMLLSGYLGSSSEEGHVRLYLDEELCRYVELPEKAIRHTQELPPEQSPLGGSLVWIDRDAEVLHGAAGSERRKATFLEGQIAQDYIGGAGGIGTSGGGGYDVAGGGHTTQTRECIGIFPTETGPDCGTSQFGICVQPTVLTICRTLTGIFCTRFGPSCRRTIFEPACTAFGPNCRTVLIQQCQSIYNPCVTQNQSYCVESGFRGCTPIDFTVVEDPYNPQVGFPGGVARQRVGGGGFDPNIGVFQTGFNCPSVFDNCATRESFCPTQDATCPSQFVICQSQFGDCFPTRTGCVSRIIRCPTVSFNCPSVAIRCPTRGEPRCFASRTFICPDTVAGCQFDTAVCGVDTGGLIQERAAILPSIVCPPPTVNISCQSRVVAACLTRFPNECQLETAIAVRCPSRVVVRCPTVLDIRCQLTRSGPRCLVSQVAVCDTRVCEFESAVCGVDPAGGGGIDPAAGGIQGLGAEAYYGQPTASPQCSDVRAAGGGAGAIGAIPQTQFCPSRVIRCQTLNLCLTQYNCPSRYIPCQSQLVRCPSALDACPTRYNCPTLPNGCPGTTQYGSCETSGPCPSAVDACPTRFGCYETQVCGGGQSIACNPGGGGGGFDPGGFGGGGFGGGF